MSRHVWLVDPLEKTIEILRLDGATYRLVATHYDAIVEIHAPQVRPFRVGSGATMTLSPPRIGRLGLGVAALILGGASGCPTPYGAADNPSTTDAAADASPSEDARGPEAGEASAVETRCLPDARFGAPTPIAGVNSPGAEMNPRLSRDELTIYFDRPDGSGSSIFFAKRMTVTESFAAASVSALSVNAASITSEGATLSSDAKTIVFSTSRTGSFDLWRAIRPSPDADFGQPSSIPELATTPAAERTPYLSVDDDALWFASNRNGSFEIFVSQRTRATYGLPVAIAELNSGLDELSPVPSRDGTFVYFGRRRTAGFPQFDIWMARRSSTTGAFDAPVPVAELAGPPDHRPGWLSVDGCRLYFSSDVSGSQDVYVAERRP